MVNSKRRAYSWLFSCSQDLPQVHFTSLLPSSREAVLYIAVLLALSDDFLSSASSLYYSSQCRPLQSQQPWEYYPLSQRHREFQKEIILSLGTRLRQFIHEWSQSNEDQKIQILIAGLPVPTSFQILDYRSYMVKVILFSNKCSIDSSICSYRNQEQDLRKTRGRRSTLQLIKLSTTHNQSWFVYQIVSRIVIALFIILFLIFASMQGQEEDYRFAFQDEPGWRLYLQQQGFVVIKHWLNKEQCEHYVQQFWDIMETLAEGRLNRNDPSTQTQTKNYPPTLHGGMIQYVGHSKPQWQLRKKTRPLFQKLWQTNNLKSSFDGFCFMNGLRSYKPSPINSFLHNDQAANKDKLWSYQGIMCLSDSDQNQGGFVVVPQSLKYHRKYFVDKGMANLNKNWFLVPEEDKETEPLNQCLKVNSKAGDFILFDSRSFHCNTVPRQNVLRVCTYICMLPAEHVPEHTKVLRGLAVKNRMTSNHHPGDGFKTFAPLPKHINNPAHFKEILQQVNNFELDESILQLI